jgi:hypothetical protein
LKTHSLPFSEICLDFVATLGKFFFAVAGPALSGVEVLSNGHQFCLAATEPFDFS